MYFGLKHKNKDNIGFVSCLHNTMLFSWERATDRDCVKKYVPIPTVASTHRWEKRARHQKLNFSRTSQRCLLLEHCVKCLENRWDNRFLTGNVSVHELKSSQLPLRDRFLAQLCNIDWGWEQERALWLFRRKLLRQAFPPHVAECQQKPLSTVLFTTSL